MQVTIEEGNKLIAIFDGWEDGRFEHLPNKLHKMEDGELLGISIDQLNYNKDWNLLMPVVEKINKLSDDWPRATESIWSLPIITPIDKVWQAVIEFINWYNTQTK